MFMLSIMLPLTIFAFEPPETGDNPQQCSWCHYWQLPVWEKLCCLTLGVNMPCSTCCTAPATLQTWGPWSHLAALGRHKISDSNTMHSYKYHAISIPCNINILQYQYHALSISYIINTMHYQYYAISIPCIINIIQYQYRVLLIPCNINQAVQDPEAYFFSYFP